MSNGGLSAARLGRMREVMAGHVERGEVPGLVALVSRRGEVHVEALGAKAVGGEPMRRDTIFRIASMTKPVAAVAAMILTGFNDNALITFLATLVPGLPDSARQAVVVGAVAGGGLTVIANAPNPAGQAILNRHFEDGIAPLGLLLGALLPTLVLFAVFRLAS